MAEHAAGWRQGPDGRWYAPVGADEHRVPVAPKDLADLAVLVNSGSLTTEIDLLVDDPDLAV